MNNDTNSIPTASAHDSLTDHLHQMNEKADAGRRAAMQGAKDRHAKRVGDLEVSVTRDAEIRQRRRRELETIVEAIDLVTASVAIEGTMGYALQDPNLEAYAAHAKREVDVLDMIEERLAQRAAEIVQLRAQSHRVETLGRPALQAADDVLVVRMGTGGRSVRVGDTAYPFPSESVFFVARKTWDVVADKFHAQRKRCTTRLGNEFAVAIDDASYLDIFAVLRLVDGESVRGLVDRTSCPRLLLAWMRSLRSDGPFESHTVQAIRKELDLRILSLGGARQADEAFVTNLMTNLQAADEPKGAA